MNISNTYFGFTDNMKPMLKVRTENTLDKQISADNKVMTHKEWIFSKVVSGYRPEVEEDYQYWSRKTRELTKPKTLYKLSVSGNYYEISKTLYDYANYIISNNYHDPIVAESFVTAEQKRIMEENRIKMEQEQQERKRQEQQRQREEEEKKRKRIERITNLQNVILSFTPEQLAKIEALTDHFITSRDEINKDNILLSNTKTEFDSIISYYDVMRHLATFKLYPETAISFVKNHRELVSENSKNPNKSNDRYVKEYKVTSYIMNEFFGITDNMPIQTIRALLQGDITADEAHNRMERNEQRKAAQEAKLQTLYRRLGTGQWIEDKGIKMELEGFTVYGLIVADNGKQPQYMLIEEQTGVAIGRGKDKSEAMDYMKAGIERMGIDKVKQTISELVKKNGISPLFKDQAG